MIPALWLPVCTKPVFALGNPVSFHTSNGDVSVTFSSGTDTIGGTDNRGEPWEKGSSYSKQYFIGWSNQDDYTANDQAKLYYSNESAQALIDDSVTDLYPVYMSGMSLVFGIGGSCTINEGLTDSQTLPDAILHGEDADPIDHQIIARYDETKATYGLDLNATFHMNKIIAHWLYTGNGSTIMTNTEGNEGSADKGVNYTYVDLNVDLDEGIDPGDTLQISFSSYYFQPYLVCATDTREKFDIEGVQAPDKWKIEELVSDREPLTTFTILNPNKVRKITVRTIVRTNKRFGGKTIPGVDARTVEGSNMILAAGKNSLAISKDKALETILQEGRWIKAQGMIDGSVKITSRHFGISPIAGKLPVAVRFAPAKVHFDKNSSDFEPAAEQDLGTSRVAYNASLKGDSLGFDMPAKPTKEMMGDALAESPAPISLPDGRIYSFKEWNTQADGKGNTVDENTIITEDSTAYAIWTVGALINEAPTLVVEDKTIEKGTDLDLMSLVKTAQDKEDGDLRSKVLLVDRGGFDKDQIGSYIVTFKLTDSQGATRITKARVTVKEKASPARKPDAGDKEKPNTGDGALASAALALLAATLTALILLKVKKSERA